jgi:hypothetical protein
MATSMRVFVVTDICVVGMGGDGLLASILVRATVVGKVRREAWSADIHRSRNCLPGVRYERTKRFR